MITTSGIIRKEKIVGEFVIEKFGDNEYVFNNDGIYSEINFNCVELYTNFQNIIFPDAEGYYFEKSLMPIWSYTAGLDSDSALSKDFFEKLVQENKSEKYHKHLYLADCHSLIGALQDRFLFIHGSFIEFYKALVAIKGITTKKDTVVWCSGANTAPVFSHLNNIFIMVYSTFDLLTKIAYELQYLETNFDKYPKLKSSNILFGDKKRLEINNSSNTIFESNEMIDIIVNIRNELIHNGSWETNPKVFIKYDDFVPTEKWILFPDMISGNIITYKNRKRFFSSDKRINSELPQILNYLMERLNNTVTLLKNKYA